MTITLEHVQPAPQDSNATSTLAAPAAPAVARTAPRTGWLTLIAESVTAARAVSEAHPRRSAAIAARFAERITA